MEKFEEKVCIEKMSKEYRKLVFSRLCKDKIYNNKLKKINKILYKYPNVSKVYRDKIIIPLSEKECRMLIKLNNYSKEISGIRERKMLYSGFIFAYSILSNSEMLKEKKLNGK